MRMKMVTTSVQVVSPHGFSALQAYSPSSPGPRSSIASVTWWQRGVRNFLWMVMMMMMMIRMTIMFTWPEGGW